METIQLAISDASYAKTLRDVLTRSAAWKVLAVETPDPCLEGVIVVDAPALDRLPSQVENPERVVLITQNDPPHLARAWEAGVVSVVFENDPISTAMLAIMAARLRVAKPARQNVSPAAGDRLPGGPGSSGGGKSHIR